MTDNDKRCAEEADQARREQERRIRDAERIAEEQKKTTRNTRIGIVVALVLAILVGVAYMKAMAAANQSHLEEQSVLKSESRALTTQSQDETKDGNGTEGTILALKALATLPKNAAKLDRPDEIEAEAALSQAVLENREEKDLIGHASAVWSAVFSRDGTRIVTASANDTARVWDAASGRSLAVLRGHTSAVWSAAFSPDGARIVTASADDTARVWDVASGHSLAVLSTTLSKLEFW